MSASSFVASNMSFGEKSGRVVGGEWDISPESDDRRWK